MDFFSPQTLLLLGIALTLVLPSNEVFQTQCKKIGTWLLQASVVLLGASLNFRSVLEQGASGALITAVSILLVFGLGFVLGMKLFKLERTQQLLITMGTAICGGSAIGALAPVLAADGVAIAVSMTVVFLLNALAIFVFPPIGHALGLGQEQFGVWAALAIHDTSSVVAAGTIYGAQALAVATTIKLTRALWIVPVTLLFSLLEKKDNKKKVAVPWFIGGFLAVSLLFNFVELPSEFKTTLSQLSKIGFSLVMLFIGLTFNFKELKSVGVKPLLFGVLLWVIVTVTSLYYVYSWV